MSQPNNSNLGEMGSDTSSPLPAGWSQLVDATPAHVLARNMKTTNRRGTRRQLGFLTSRSRRYGLTPADLIDLGVNLGRLDPARKGVTSLSDLTFDEVGGLFDIVHAWEEAEMGLLPAIPAGEPIRFLPYHRGATPDSRDVPHGFGYALPCPKCGSEYVHVSGIRLAEGPYDRRPCAEVALDCERGCTPTLRFANYKGTGYCHWIDEDRPALYEPLSDEAARIIEETDDEDPLPESVLSELMGSAESANRYREGLLVLGFLPASSFRPSDAEEADPPGVVSHEDV